jgi:hypothetical protein
MPKPSDFHTPLRAGPFDDSSTLENKRSDINTTLHYLQVSRVSLQQVVAGMDRLAPPCP